MGNHNTFSHQCSDLITKHLKGLSPIQTIMKIAEDKEIRKLGFQPDEIISFGGGWCNHPSSELLREIYIDITKDKTLFHKSGRYSPIKGDFECISQLCSFEKEIYHISNLTHDNIILGHSSTQLLHDLLRVLQNPGPSICVLDPTYANYENTVKCSLPNTSISYIPALNTTTWTYLEEPQHSLDVLQDYCRNGSKIFILPVPDNPTSQIPSNSFIQSVQEILEDYKGYLVLDFAYKALWFGKMPDCFSWSPNSYENVISLHSHSKWLSSLGRRFGWIEAHPYLIKNIEKITESTLLSPDTMHSMATTRFLNESINNKSLKKYIDNTRDLYKKTSEILISEVENHLDWKYIKPKGGLYTVCPTPNKEEPMRFVERILQHTGVLLIPGNGFGPSMEKAVRISYGPLCTNHEKIKIGIRKISKYLN